MIKNATKITLIAILALIKASGSYAQPAKALISVRYDHLIENVDNSISIVAQQKEPVSLNQVSAAIIGADWVKKELKLTGNDGMFTIHPKSSGVVEITIKLKDTTEVKDLIVKPTTANVRLLGYKANEENKISVTELKKAKGLYPIVENQGFDAKCAIDSYEIYRIRSKKVTSVKNKGATFSEKSKSIIRKTKSGDLYVFRKIKYRCPGGKESLRAEDMTFEIN